MPRFGGELERATIDDALTVELNQSGGFLANIGPPVAIAAAGILHSHFAVTVFDYEAIAAGFIMAKLNQFAAAPDTDLAWRCSVAKAHFPASTLERVQHGERGLRQHRSTENGSRYRGDERR